MLLTLKNLCFHYTYFHGFKKTKKQILSNINLTLQDNTNIALIGRSGCGKSTLAKLIAQLHKPKSGEILLYNQPIDTSTITKKRDFYMQVQILFQDPISSLNPRLSIFENLQEPLLYLLGMKDKRQRLERIYPLLDSLKLPRSILQSYPTMISGGQAQRICIARMLLIQPKLILLDETTSGLDYELQQEVWNLFLTLQQQTQCCFFFITHDILLARQFCQRLLLMQNNTIIEDIPSHERFQSTLGKEFEECNFYTLL